MATTSIFPHISFSMLEEDNVNWFLDWMSAFNERRLYWVWAGRGGVLGATIDLLPDDFFYKTQAIETLDILVPYTGSLSWALYYFRCILLLRHIIPGPWMSDEDKKIPWQLRLEKKWHQYKFDFLNDFFWATGNLACFFWLYGPLDYYGGALTSVLLLMDVSLCIWGYWEAYVQYSKDLDYYRKAIQNASADEINALQLAKRQCMLDWDYKLYALYIDVMYAISLLVAFSLIYAFFLPLAIVPTAAGAMLSLIGTVLCFTLNSGFSALKQGVDVCKSVAMANDVARDHENQNQNGLNLESLERDWVYHQHIIAYKQVCLLRSVLIDFLVPPVVFMALVFMPLSMGLSVVSAGLILAVASYEYIDKNYPHDIAALPACSSEAACSPVIAQGFFGKATAYLHENSTSEMCLN